MSLLPDRLRPLAAIAAAVGVCLYLACGADDLVAPAPAPKPVCRTAEGVLAKFLAAVHGGRTEGLRVAIEAAVADPSGATHAAADLMRHFFGTLADFSRAPPEPGATPEAPCASVPPPVEDSAPLCELLRTGDLFVHQGHALRVLELLEPIIAGMLDYVVGRPPSSNVPHVTEVAEPLRRMCGQTVVCRIEDGLELTVAAAQLFERPGEDIILDHVLTLAQNPALRPFLAYGAAGDGGTTAENGVVSLVQTLESQIVAMTSPADLDRFPIDQFPPELQGDVRTLIEDLKRLLDPGRTPNLLAPLKRALACHQAADPNGNPIRMIYRLGMVQALPAFGLVPLLSTLVAVRDGDPRRGFAHLVRVFAEAMLKDHQAVDSAASVCRSLVDPALVGPALTSAADLFRDGILQEAVCAADALVHACSALAPPGCP